MKQASAYPLVRKIKRREAASHVHVPSTTPYLHHGCRPQCTRVCVMVWFCVLHMPLCAPYNMYELRCSIHRTCVNLTVYQGETEC